jgi:Xaa-Pro aminopeptidase
MKYKPVEPTLFKKNREKLSKILNKNSVAILHSSDEMPRNGDQYFNYRQNSDFFYFSGIEQEKSVLVLCPDHPNEKMKEILFLLKPNKTMEIWQGHKLTKEEAQKTSGIQTVKWLDEYDSVLGEIMYNNESVYLNIEENARFQPEILSRDSRKQKELRKKFPLHKFDRLAPHITSLRLVKEKEELDLMIEACRITNKAFHRVLKNVKPGIFEYEVEAEMTYEFLKNGASGHAYAPIVASGKNACVLHYVDNDSKSNDGDLLLMDFGAEYANYAADCTRTIPVNGKFTERQKECYQSVLNVLKKTQKLLVPGTTINEVNKKVNLMMEEEMIKLGLFTKEDVLKQDTASPMYFNYFMHGTSHFIGLDVHDVGGKDVILKKGMVLTCEPGLYIAEENMGIRLENDILVDDEPINLMLDIPIEIDEIEVLMK